MMALPGQQRLGKNGQVGKSVGVWLIDKAEHDKVTQGLWRVHGKVYDLTDFIPVHPGGAHWLTRTKGLDITDWYETHHIDTSMTDAILQKYFVEDQPEHPPLPYIYSKDNLYGKIKSKVLELSKRERLSESTLQMKVFVATFLLISFLSLIYLYVENSWTSALLYAFCHYVLTGIGHNYSHRNSWLGTVMDFSLYSKQQWVVSHCLSHHIYPNLERDLEILAFEPLIYFLTSQPENSWLAIPNQYLIAFASVLLLPVQQFVDIIKRIEPFRIQQLIFPLQFGLACWFHGFNGFLMMWFAHGVCLILSMLHSFPEHGSLGAWTQGDKDHTRDFAVQAMKVTRDHSQGMSLVGSMLIFQGFTDHVAHHLFPTVDRSKLPLITPLIVETCREMKLSHLYTTHRFSTIFWDFFKFLCRKKPNHKA